MRVRHEVMIWDLPLDADPNELLSISGIGESSNAELISISNYDELTDEDIPSLLIRQESDVELDPNVVGEFVESGSERLISAAYTSAHHQYPASRLRRRSVWSQSPTDFKLKHPNWSADVSRLDQAFTQNALKLYNTLRWASGHLGKTGETADRIMLADLGAQGWAVLHSSRDGLMLYFWDSGPVRLDQSTRHRLEDLMGRNRQEPLARGMLREASQHRISSPRVALIMAVAAAEAGVKGFIADRIPAWSQALVVDAQQLPLHKILREVIPGFLTSEFGISNPKLPSESVVSPILKAVEFRNVAIHQPPDSPKSQALTNELTYGKVIELLTAISDLLYLLDLFAGESWAIDMLSRQSREDWLIQTSAE